MKCSLLMNSVQSPKFRGHTIIIVFMSLADVHVQQNTLLTLNTSSIYIA
uniref:Uncharacterized protein n=1 Tax=Anguilla anguilla TaxID=7936 RepID=A0A0E9UUP1_ANGAN